MFLACKNPSEMSNVDFFKKLWCMPHIYVDLIKIINVSDGKNTPLIYALQQNWPEDCIDLLVRNGAAITPQYDNGIDAEIPPERLKNVLSRNCIIYDEGRFRHVEKPVMWDLSIFDVSQVCRVVHFLNF